MINGSYIDKNTLSGLNEDLAKSQFEFAPNDHNLQKIKLNLNHFVKIYIKGVGSIQKTEY